MMKKGFNLWGLLGPAMFWLVMFFLIPLGMIVVYSFAQRGAYGEIRWVLTGENYLRAVDLLYLKILLRSFGVASVTTVSCLIIGYPLAYFVAFAPPRLKNILLVLLVIPFWTNFLIRTYAWMVILQEQGLLNMAFLRLGLIAEPLHILFTLKGVMIGMIYGYLPFMTLPIYSSLEKLDPLLLEVSTDLGAHRFETFLRVTLPLTTPGIAAGAVLVFVTATGDIIIPDMLGGKTFLIGNLISNQFLLTRDWPFGSALTILLMLFLLSGIGIFLKYNQVEHV